ncbi:unnamed protein product [Rhodiola kirilowii]
MFEIWYNLPLEISISSNGLKHFLLRTTDRLCNSLNFNSSGRPKRRRYRHSDVSRSFQSLELSCSRSALAFELSFLNHRSVDQDADLKSRSDDGTGESVMQLVST